MRTGLYIPQRAIVEKNLLGNVNTDALLLLDYLRRWVTCKNVKKVRAGECDFFWIKYAQACRDLPILFPHRPTLRTQINKIVRLVASLKENGLIFTLHFGSRCYIHLTEAAHELYVKPTPDTDSRLDKQAITAGNDGPDTEKYDAPVTPSRDTYREEQYRKELYHTQNSYSDEEFESVKRQVETIFPVRNWSITEIDLLRIQMPIPTWELTLIQRFYKLISPAALFLQVIKMTEAEFLLTRRRHTLKTLLENWSDEVSRARFFFKTEYGMVEAEKRRWHFMEMEPPSETT